MVKVRKNGSRESAEMKLCATNSSVDVLGNREFKRGAGGGGAIKSK